MNAPPRIDPRKPPPQTPADRELARLRWLYLSIRERPLRLSLREREARQVAA